MVFLKHFILWDVSKTSEKIRICQKNEFQEDFKYCFVLSLSTTKSSEK